VVEAQWVARTRGLGRFVTEQPPYSMLVRAIERDLLPVALEHDMGVLPWSPLAGGWLSGRFRLGADAPDTHRAGRMPARYNLSLPENQLKLERADALAKLAESAGISLVEMAVAWVNNHPAVTSAIIGPRTMEQFESQLGAADVEMSADVLDGIDAIVPPGTNSSPNDGGYDPPSLTDARLRRR
jgi:aryl-alcohol dehydrogenase-like predicted oxidoreductase